MRMLAGLTLLLASATAFAGRPGPKDPLEAFSSCKRSLPAQSKTYVEAKCVGQDPSGLVGRLHKELVEFVGYPDWCLKDGQTETDGMKCFMVTDIAYSYYVVPLNTVGGGPELMITLSKEGRVTGAKWSHSQ